MWLQNYILNFCNYVHYVLLEPWNIYITGLDFTIDILLQMCNQEFIEDLNRNSLMTSDDVILWHNLVMSWLIFYILLYI